MCYRCYKRAPPVRKLSVPGKMRFRQMRPHSDDGRMQGRRGVRRGHDRHDWSQGCPNAPWTAYADKFPCPRRKLSTGGVDALWTADMDKFPRSGRKPLREAFIRFTGANAAYWGRRWSARTGLRSGRNRLERRLSGFSRAVGTRPSRRLYSPVTRIQSPIKEKAQKNAFLQNHRIH